MAVSLTYFSLNISILCYSTGNKLCISSVYLEDEWLGPECSFYNSHSKTGWASRTMQKGVNDWMVCCANSTDDGGLMVLTVDRKEAVNPTFAGCWAAARESFNVSGTPYLWTSLPICAAPSFTPFSSHLSFSRSAYITACLSDPQRLSSVRC